MKDVTHYLLLGHCFFIRLGTGAKRSMSSNNFFAAFFILVELPRNGPCAIERWTLTEAEASTTSLADALLVLRNSSRLDVLPYTFNFNRTLNTNSRTSTLHKSGGPCTFRPFCISYFLHVFPVSYSITRILYCVYRMSYLYFLFRIMYSIFGIS